MIEENAYYQGFDMNVFVRFPKKRAQLELGVLGGDTYPVIDNLNYYLGGRFFISSKNKKYIFDANPKLMFAYSIKPYSASMDIVRKNFSFQFGLNVYRRINKFEVGIGYYIWHSDYKALIKAKEYLSPNSFTLLYQKTGFVPIGIFKISTRFILGK